MTAPTTYLSKAVLEYLQDVTSLSQKGQFGICNTKIPEDKPNWQPAGCEHPIFEGYNNTYMVFGRDRPGSACSGAGGRGDTQCGAIDIVAGRLGSVSMHNIRNGKEPIGSDTATGNNFFADAARIYITQRALNIDQYLGFQNEEGSDPTELSAVAIKSDCTRIVGRESVRIYAGGAAGDGFGPFGELRADGTPIDNPKIELIVGNRGEDDMQPAVLGENLISYMLTNNKAINRMHDILQSLQQQINMIQFAFTFIDGGAMLSSGIRESIDNVVAMLDQLFDQFRNDINHLNTGVLPGANSILSQKVFIT